MAFRAVTLSPSNTAAILLAAGAATRFGGDKLAAPLRGGTVLSLSATALAASQCRLRAIIIPPRRATAIPADFEPVVNPDAGAGLSASLRVGVEWAEAHGAAGMLVALADMPFIESQLYTRLFEAANKTSNQCAFTLTEKRRSPPALFGARWFEKLKRLEGDVGARALLAGQPDGAGVIALDTVVADIDTQEDFSRLQKSEP